MISMPASPPHTGPEVRFADVIVPRHLAGPFTYLVPLSLQSTLRIGHRVLVPFGRSVLQGAVVALFPALPHGLDRGRLKEIHSLLPEGAATDVDSTLFELSRQVAEQYIAPWGQCLRLVLPPVSKPRASVTLYELTEQGQAVRAARGSCSAKARALLTRLGKKPIALRRSARNAETAVLLQDFKTRGWVVEVSDRAQPSSSTPTLDLFGPMKRGRSGSSGQLVADSTTPWAEPLFTVLRNGEPTRVLVQASWPDRLKLLRETIRLVVERGKTVLILVGEAERAQWVTGLLRDDETGIFPICFHSGLSDQAKAELWEQTHRQAVQVVVGTRSAVFLPLTGIGAIWVEGEEDAALKEPQEPRYHARDVAWLRAQSDRAVLVLSSFHPSLEARAAVGQMGTMVCTLTRSESRANVRLVDLRDHGYGTVLSRPLIQAIEQTVGRKAGVLLFLNRKGYAGALVCRDCGQVPRCSSCRVALMYSRQAGHLLCSYCGDLVPIPETCPSCSGPRMQSIGEGTERVEEDAKRLFPRATVLRLDGDTMKRPAQAEALWRRVEQGEWDIVVGTQLLLRHGPLPTMGLVGIVQADAGLSVPDFRSAERTYHMLLDAVSLADSAGSGGQVIVQTSLSSHHAIRAVAQQDESIFLSEELAQRTALGYPPAVHLIALLVSGTDEPMVRDVAMAWVARLTASAKASSAVRTLDRSDRLTVLGPVPSPVSKLRGRYRWQILVKSLEREAGLEAVRTTVKDLEQRNQRRAIKFDVDVDPIEMW